MEQFNVTEAKARLSQLRLVVRRHPGSAQGQVTMSKDFGGPVDDMSEYR
jgi:hypothetical protein